ncbi:DUF2341 domain-containing protein [Methanocaldococcus indicus]|uniref:DUF2341 domain-containing protein n=1 Tax=Methanocaldococcus indicus TaxID=213231 RepID=UPI003C6D4F40
MKKIIFTILLTVLLASVYCSDFKYYKDFIFYSKSSGEGVYYVTLNVSGEPVSTDWYRKISVYDLDNNITLKKYVAIINNTTVRVYFLKNWKKGLNFVRVYYDSDIITEVPDSPDIFTFIDDFENSTKFKVLEGNVSYYFKNSTITINSTTLSKLSPNLSVSGNYTISCKIVNFTVQSYPYWIEDTGSNYYIWTKVNISANSNITLYIKKVDGYHPDGDSVFLFFDDFDADSLNNSIWSVYGTSSTTVDIVDGWLRLHPDKENSNIGVKHYCSYSNVRIGIKYNYVAGDGCEIPYLDIDGNKISLPKTSYPNDSATGTQIHYYETGRLSISSYIGLLQSRAGWDGETRFDYIFVRKYADKEPTVSVEQISTDTWKVTITNPNDYDLTDFQVKINGTGIVNSKTDSLLISNYNGIFFANETVPSYLGIIDIDVYNNTFIATKNNEEIIKTGVINNTTGIFGISLLGSATYDWFLVYKKFPVLLIATSSNYTTELINKTITLYNENNKTTYFYSKLDKIDSNLTLIFSNGLVSKIYTITPENYNSTLNLEVPVFGELTVIYNGWVRKFSYGMYDENINVIIPTSDVVSWYIRLDKTSDVRIEDTSGNVLSEYKNTLGFEFPAIVGRTYRIYINGKLKDEKTAISNEYVYYQTSGNVGELTIVNNVSIPQSVDLIYNSIYKNGTININYSILQNVETSIKIEIYDDTGKLLYNTTVQASNQINSLKVYVGNSSTYYRVVLTTADGKKYVSLVYTPNSTNTGFSLLENWKKWISILILFITLVTFSYIDIEAGTIATISMMLFLELIGFLDWMDIKLKSVLFFLLLVPLGLKIKRGW